MATPMNELLVGFVFEKSFICTLLSANFIKVTIAVREIAIVRVFCLVCCREKVKMESWKAQLFKTLFVMVLRVLQSLGVSLEGWDQH